MRRRTLALKGTLALTLWSVAMSEGWVASAEFRGDDLTRITKMLVDAQNLASNERAADLEAAVEKLEVAFKLLQQHTSSASATNFASICR